jgi:2,4-dienoyl-CoA reductase-like NADH-dependent reductase (Old Yellow Enzyme family)
MSSHTHSSKLFSPYSLRGLRLKNRIVVSPMAQYAADDGAANDFLFAHFAKFAIGGAGLVFTEATKVERRGLGTIGDMGLWSDAHIAPLVRIVDFLHAHGAAAGIQLNHAGRKGGNARPWEGYGPLDRSVPVEGRPHWDVVAPSAIAYMEGWPTPREMSEADIAQTLEAFAQAARRADAAGFDVIELHGAHGYLLHQFLSAETNRRTDAWGGSAEARMRFPLEVVSAVRRHWPEGKPLFFRISSTDEAGWTLDDSVGFARALKARGVDLIDCSSGGLSVRSPTAAGTKRRMGYQVPYAERIRREAGIASMAVGLIIEPEHAERIVASGRADLVAIGREMLFNPFWAAHAALKLGVDPHYELMPPNYQWWLDRRGRAGWLAEEEPEHAR